MRTKAGKLSMTAQAMEIVRAFMGDGEEHGRKDVVREIKEKIADKAELTDGIISGAIKVMIEHGEMECIEKGVYKLSLNGGNTELKQRGIRLLTKFQRDLGKLCMVNVLQLDEEDMKYIKGLQALNESIKNNEVLMPKDSTEAETAPADSMKTDVPASPEESITQSEQSDMNPEAKPEKNTEEKSGVKQEVKTKETLKDAPKTPIAYKAQDRRP